MDHSGGAEQKSTQELASTALRGALAKTGEQPQTTKDWSTPIIAAAQRIGVQSVATAYQPIGPVQERLDRAESKLAEAGVTLHRLRHQYDSISWPHAKAGFFALKKEVPGILADLNLLR